MKKHIIDIICIIIFITVVCLVFYFKTTKNPDVEINTIQTIDEYVNKDVNELENPFSEINNKN